MAVVDVQHAVSVQEQRRAAQTGRQLGARPR
jgi:hypothetical protein